MKTNTYKLLVRTIPILLILTIFLFSNSSLFAQISVDKVVPLERDSSGLFGEYVGISGNKMVVGSPGDDEEYNNAGAAYFFERINGEWVQTAKVFAEDAEVRDFFGRSVHIDGNRAIIGAPSKVLPNTCPFNECRLGAAYIFEYQNGTWSQTAKLLPGSYFFEDENSGAATNTLNFGWDVDLQGNTAVVAMPFDMEADGSTHIFEYDGSSWNETQKITATDVNIGTFGSMVDLDGNKLIVGDLNYDINGLDAAGATFVYKKDAVNGNWFLEETLRPNDPVRQNQVGRQGAISGDWIILGSPFDEDPCGGPVPGEFICTAGAAYIYKRENDDWTFVEKIFDSQIDSFAQYGWEIVMDSERAFIGARSDIDACPTVNGITEFCGAGAVYIFELMNGAWQFQSKLLPEDDNEQVQQFGFDMSLDGPWLAVGAPSSIFFLNDDIPDFGAVYVYKIFNRNPIAVDDSGMTDAGVGITIQVLNNDSDPDQDQLSVAILEPPSNGTAVVNGNQSISYTPNSDFDGLEIITYTLTDEDGGTDVGTVEITVMGPSNVFDEEELKTYLTNSPNPFSGTTTIHYVLPKTDHVNLSVFDAYGRLVKVLVNQNVAAGSHKVDLNTEELSQGNFYFRLETSAQRITKIMSKF